MCNCSKPIEQSELEMLREFNNDSRFFIYHISDDKGLTIAHVPEGSNPNAIALERGFIGKDGEVEWYNTNEYPLLYE